MPIPTLSDDELALSMKVFMEQHGIKRMLKATAKACHLFGLEKNSIWMYCNQIQRYINRAIKQAEDDKLFDDIESVRKPSDVKVFQRDGVFDDYTGPDSNGAD